MTPAEVAIWAAVYALERARQREQGLPRLPPDVRTPDEREAFNARWLADRRAEARELADHEIECLRRDARDARKAMEGR